MYGRRVLLLPVIVPACDDDFAREFDFSDDFYLPSTDYLIVSKCLVQLYSASSLRRDFYEQLFFSDSVDFGNDDDQQLHANDDK